MSFFIDIFQLQQIKDENKVQELSDDYKFQILIGWDEECLSEFKILV